MATRKVLGLLCGVALPVSAAAQGLLLAPPDLGQALRQMDRMHGLAEHGERRVGSGLEQTIVLPERPGQNQVSWYDFDWHHYDIPSPSGGQGGIRLYYYGRERGVAERALPVIRNAYLRLVDQFHYTPTKQIPYILYSSKREFQTTNIFQVSEGVLGVTSPRDLKMSLPYFGDHELFREVSTHELVHQFTIQKLLDLAGDDSTAIEGLPLWYIEGIAEYYAKGGLDPEADLYLRDLVWNPDPERRYAVIPFGEDRIRGYIPTYKLGQARITFIADVYGKEKVQAFLENAAPGVGAGGGGVGPPGGERGFAALVRRVLNEPLEQVDGRWRTWLKRRYYPEYMKVQHDLPQVRDITELPAEPDAFEVSPDGQLIFFRGIDREAGRARLYLVDPRYPPGARVVVSDNQPGYESLHPIEHSVMAVGNAAIAFAAQRGAGDALYVQAYRHEPPKGGRPPSISLGDRRRLELKHPKGYRFIEISDPAFSPDDRQLAFVALTDSGQRDIYVVPAEGGLVRQITDDFYAERELAWGKDGIYCTSDATDHGRFNVFRIDAATSARTRLTQGNWNDHHPRPLGDGSVLFASEAGGKPDVYLLASGTARRLSDFATGLYAPSPSAQGRGVWAGTFYRGRFRLVELPRVAWLDEPPVAVAAAPDVPPLDIPQDDIPERTPRYNAFSWGNWRPEAGYVFGGGASGSVAGQAALLFTDTLRDHVLFLNVAVLGSFDLTQALILFEDRSKRTAWVYGGFHYVQQQLDRTDPNVQYLQRDFGGVVTARFPIDRFRRFETDLTFGFVQRYCVSDFNPQPGSVFAVPNICGGLINSTLDPVKWEEENGGVNPQFGPTFRYGYDTIQYDPYTGPLQGSSFMAEVGGGALPTKRAVHGFFRFDGAKFFRIVGRSNLMFRLAAGTSFAPNAAGKAWERNWWITAADNLRGYYALDVAYLVGQHYYVANAELQIPLDPILRLAIFDYIEGVAALDFGGVFDQWSRSGGVDPRLALPRNLSPWDVRTLSGVLGFNVLFGPLLLRVHFGHPFDIGGIRTPAQQLGSNWVTNITLRYFFF
jgi:hypothetical protein